MDMFPYDRDLHNERVKTLQYKHRKSVNTARSLEYDGPFFNIVHERNE